MIIHNNTIPLCFLPDSRLICYRYGRIVVFKEGVECASIPVFKSIKERYLSQSKILSRLFRIGIRAAVAIDDSVIVLSVGDLLYEFNIFSGMLSKGASCGDGVRPLSFSKVKGIDGFHDGIYFGGYVHNFNKNPVSIYYRKNADEWEIVYTFPRGIINHIHSIVPDSYRQCLWVLTGDFNESAAIWKITNGFKKVERVVWGDQKWRGCVAFALPEGLLYATDAPFIKNHIYLLRDDLSLDAVGIISGSCIYGCQWKENYVFSTVVEPDGRNETFMRLILGWKRGAGIKDNYARIYCGNLKNGFKAIYQEKKDKWPFIFQFGAFRFPSGENNFDSLFFQPIATKKNDLALMKLVYNP